MRDLEKDMEHILENSKLSMEQYGRMGPGIFVEIEGQEKRILVGFTDGDIKSKYDMYDALNQMGQMFKNKKKIVAITFMSEIITINKVPSIRKKQEAISIAYWNLVTGYKELWIQPYQIDKNRVTFGELSINKDCKDDEVAILKHFINGYIK